MAVGRTLGVKLGVGVVWWCLRKPWHQILARVGRGEDRGPFDVVCDGPITGVVGIQGFGHAIKPSSCIVSSPFGEGGNTHGCAQVGEETWARPGWLLARCIAAAGVTLSHHPRTRGTHGSMPPTTPIRQPLGSEVAATVVVPVSASGRSRFCPLNSPGFSQASAPGVAFIPPRDPNPPTKSHSGVPWVATGLCPKINPRNYGEGGPLAFSAGPFEQPCAEGRAKSQRGCPVAKPP